MPYPDYQYYVGTNAARYGSNPWVLVVHTPSGGINFDQFMYFPLQNYQHAATEAPSLASETGHTFMSRIESARLGNSRPAEQLTGL
jgi:hypothetical protein